MTATLKANSGRYTWVAATIGSNEASGYQLATGDPVMAIGGFNGTDPAPTLAQFETDVQEGKIHYFIGAAAASAEAGPVVGARRRRRVRSGVGWPPISPPEPSVASPSMT